MAEDVKTAIVTGGCSGIGLGLVRHLLSSPAGQKWRVVLADIRQDAYDAISSSLDAGRHKFIRTDVGSWEDQASLFRQSYEYSNGRIDFLAANAGTAERAHVTLGNPFTPEDVDADPVKPPTTCTQVNQLGPFYGLKLFVHYTRRTAKRLKGDSNAANGTSTDAFNPKMVITSSCTALYPFPVAPEYCMTKHAVMALARSLGPLLLQSDNIGLNCIMPAYVDTGLTPNEVTSRWPKEWITPISTMVRAYDELISDTGKVNQDGNSDGKDGVVKTGQAVECVLDKLFYREPVPYPDESQKYCIEQGLDVQNGVWWTGMRALMEKMVAQGQNPSMVYQASDAVKS